MRTSTHNRFAFFHQNEGLLFQFFFHECLTIQQLLQTEDLAIINLSVFGSKMRSGWMQDMSSMEKLLHYYDLLMTHFVEPTAPASQILKKAINKIPLAARACETRTILPLLYPFRQALKAVMRALVEQLPNGKEHPHLLLFLLNHQQQIDSFLEEFLVRKYLSLLFPNSFDELESFLLDFFSNKGFHDLLPLIQQKFQAFQLPISQPKIRV